MLYHFHGASIGETNCALIVIRQLHAAGEIGQNSVLLAYTSSSVRISDAQLKEFPNLKVCRLNGVPGFDRALYREIRKFDERCLIIFEKDRRPDLIALYRGDHPILNVEGKPPQGKLHKLWNRCSNSLSKIDWFCVENDAYRDEILELCPQANVSVTGTLKGTTVRRRRTPSSLSSPDPLAAKTQTVSFVSVLVHEISPILGIIRDVRHTDVGQHYILLPRYLKATPLREGGKKAFQLALKDSSEPVFIVDSIEELEEARRDNERGIFVLFKYGEVRKVLDQSDAAVICGSLAKGRMAHGHNIFEPLAREVPTFIGPYARNWQHSIDELLGNQALVQGNCAELAAHLKKILDDPSLVDEIVSKINASPYLRYNQESPERITTVICEFLDRQRGNTPFAA